MKVDVCDAVGNCFHSEFKTRRMIVLIKNLNKKQKTKKDAYFEKYSMGSYQKRVEITTNKIVPVKTIESTLQQITLFSFFIFIYS